MAAVGAITITSVPISRADPNKSVQKITLAWTSSAGGAVSGIPTASVSGTIVRVVFAPGTPAPTDNYDVTLLDEQGFDVLAGQGANQSATVPASVCPGVPLKDGTTISTVPAAVGDALSLVVANAGNAKQGTVVLYIK